jgi:tetratricopeptide (TPR) repeat protein
MELAEALVVACMKACHVPPDLTKDVVEQWLADWRRLAGLTLPEDEGRDSRFSEPGGELVDAGIEVARSGDRPLVGRRDALHTFEQTLDEMVGGRSQFVAVVGEPGAGKTRLLGELAAAAARRDLVTLSGRTGEFEQEMPLGVVVDALDDRLEMCEGWVRDRLGTAPARLLAAVFPSLSTAIADDPVLAGPDVSRLARYQVYRAVRRLLEELATSSGLVLILDDIHWADEASVQLLVHLLRHAPRGRVLVAVAYRPAQVAPQVTALIQSAVGQGHLVSANPLTLAEVEEFLGPPVGRARSQVLYEASGGNPFYLEALARMGRATAFMGGGEDIEEAGGLPPPVRAALQVELRGLSSTALLVARAAAVVANEFEPAVAAVAAQVDEEVVLAALDEMAARDIVRPAASGRRFQFRHPLVRNVAYGLAGPGWRLAAHARIAAYLADLGAPATMRAHHVERSGRFGDEAAVTTLVEAAGTVAWQAPATAAHWLLAALQLMAPDSNDRDFRLDVLLKLAQAQMVSGRLAEGQKTAREVLRLMPVDDQDRHARALRICAVIERLLGRPDESRALLLAGLRQMPDPQSAATVPLRVRLVADSLYRSDYRAAQAILDMLPETSEDWQPILQVAVAALRPMPAFAAGRIADAARYITCADQLVTAVPDEQLAEWMNPITWLCWTELFMGRYHSALRRLDRVLAIARSTGQNSFVIMMLTAHGRAYGMLGRLTEGALTAEEATGIARRLGSDHLLAIALAQECLIAAWSGDDGKALRCGAEVIRMAGNSEEWLGALAWYSWALALINVGRLDQGTDAVVRACNGFKRPKLDQPSLLSCCELMAYAETARGRPAQANLWANRAGKVAHPGLEMNLGLAKLARAHALRATAPAAAAEHARHAAEALAATGQRVDSGRARLCAGVAHAEADEVSRAREQLQHAAEIFAGCGARSLHAQALHELRRIG